MKIKQHIYDDRRVGTIAIENVHFQKSEVYKYVSLFDKMVQDNYIIADSFEAPVWRVYNFIANVHQAIFFDLDIYREIQLALKCYTTAQLTIGKRWATVLTNFQFIKEIVYKTNGFKDIEMYQEYISFFMKKDPRRCYLSSRALVNFLSFYCIENRERFVDISYSLRSVHTKNRDLPHMDDVISFDSIINQYFKEIPIETHMKFKPVQLWWSLTNIIPMRPSEFLLTSFDCINADSNGLCWITIPRIKDATDSPEEVISLENLRYQTFQISQDMYNVISEFKLRLLKKNFESDFLFSYQFYQSTFNQKASRESNHIENRMNSNHFRHLLRKFNKEIVIGLYNENFEVNVVPSHTRHFAIINMFLQGFNLLSIAQLAGQLDLRTADNYYSHAKEFAKSYVYNFVTSSMGNSIGRKMSDGFLGWRRDIIDKSKMYTYQDLSGLRKVEYGFCKDNDFPYNCGEYCAPCPHFIFQPSVNEYVAALVWLETYSTKLDSEIDIVLETMIETCQSLRYSFTPNKEEAFVTKAKKLQSYIDQKIRTDILISGLRE